MSTQETSGYSPARPPREQQAWDEIGQTAFRPGVKVFCTAFFLCIILLVPVIQFLIPEAWYDSLAGVGPEERTPTELPEAAGVVTSVSARPRAGAVYKDFVMTLRVESDTPSLIDEVVEIRVLGMKDRVMTPAATIRVGDRVSFRYHMWEQVADAKGSLKTALLDDTNIFDPPPMLWAESLHPEGKDSTGPMAFLTEWDGGVSAALAAWRNGEGGLLRSLLDANAQLGRSINHYEDALDDRSWLTLAVTPPFQALLVRLKAGNEKAYVGREGWLFFEPGVRSLTGRGFLDPVQIQQRERSGGGFTDAVQADPRPAILQFHADLKRRGIELVLLPTPVKPSIHPEKFSPRFAGYDAVLQNRSFDAWKQEMEKAGVQVLDSAALLKHRALTEGEQYLATDTHWRPEAMQAVASMVAEALKNPFDFGGGSTMAIEQSEVTQLGDIGVMLELPESQDVLSPETVTLRRVLPDGLPWEPTRGAEILLLGDSFTNIYSVEAMGWGDSAGFAEQLSLELGKPIDRISRNDAGAFATRQILAEELAADPTRLDAVTTVVWQFADRELAVGNWKDIPIGVDEVSDPTFPNLAADSGSDPVVWVEVQGEEDPLVAMARMVNEEIGDAAAFAARDSWLFLRDELLHLGTGRFWGEGANPTRASKDPDPFTAIVDLDRKLEALGIDLLLMPVPPRAAVYADTFLDGIPLDDKGIPRRFDVYHQQFYSELREAGVEVMDLTEAFLEARATDADEGTVCLHQDTHWSARGVAMAAARLASALKTEDWLEETPKRDTFLLPEETLQVKGDLADRVPGFAPSTMDITVRRVSTDPESFAKVPTDPDSPVLLLTDSHGLVFHAGGDMLMEGAGIADRLAYELGISVDLMAMRGSGSSVRRELARRFLTTEDARKKQVVVYLFAARAFTESGNWTPVPLEAE